MATEVLTGILQNLEGLFSTESNNSASKEEISEYVEKFLKESLSLGLNRLATLGKSIKSWLDTSDFTDPISQETKQAIQFALATIREFVAKTEKDIGEKELEEFYEITGLPVPSSSYESTTLSEKEYSEDYYKLIDSIVESSSPSEELDMSYLSRLIEKTGGEIVTLNGDKGFFYIKFPAFPDKVKYLERMFSLYDPEEGLGSKYPVDEKFMGIVLKIKEFMFAFSQNDISKAKDILKEVAEIQEDKVAGGLYGEIGKIARKLHESLKAISRSLDPQLREFAEDKLPDSEDRLEHILKLTEKAANTTLDHVEQLQERKSQEENMVLELKSLVSSLLPLSDTAKSKLEKASRIGDELLDLFVKDDKDLVTIMTAQDFQDLTGQIIIKIIQLLKELEAKLIDLIKTFGISIRKDKEPKAKELLYGPAHEKKKALKSQDDVDALLAEFGF